MKKLLLALLTAASAQVASAASEIVVTLNSVTKVLTFDFSGLEEGVYLSSYNSAGNGLLTFVGSADYGAFTNPVLISNTLVDRDSNPVANELVHQFIRQYEDYVTVYPLTALGIGNSTQSGNFTISGGTVSYDASDYLFGNSTNYFANFPFTEILYGSVSGTDTIIVRGVTVVPEPASFAVLAGLGALALAGTRRRRA